ncbi:MAG: hypothetical protein K0R78_1128 [Pelosinus sp.]|nr:hypothetical protein [Pelosinus sp.]
MTKEEPIKGTTLESSYEGLSIRENYGSILAYREFLYAFFCGIRKYITFSIPSKND